MKYLPLDRLRLALIPVGVALATWLLPAIAQATVSLCVFDPSGANGDAFQLMKDYRAAAVSWGARLELKPYLDEKTAAEDLKAGQCQAALLTGARARTFNRFAGSVEALGAIRSYDEMKTVSQLLANPKIAKKLESAAYTSVGIFPVGAVYLHVSDKRWDSVASLAGKRIATLDFDEAALALVRRVGAAVVPADIGTFAGMFNNGHVDAAYAPATAFKPLELEKGLAKGGGIVKLPLAQLTLQLVVRRDAKLPTDFEKRSRQYAADHVDTTLRLVKKAEGAIAQKYWIELGPEATKRNEEVFRQVRIALRDQGVLDATLLTLLRRVRCQGQPARAECAEKSE